MINEVEALDSWWIEGMTALRDAIGESIKIGEELIRANDVKDQSVLVVILTDGQENASKEWSDKEIKFAIKQKEESDKWTFTFVGGELQAEEMIAKMGFDVGNTTNCSFTTASMSSTSGKTLRGLDKYYTARKAGIMSVKNFYEEDKDDKDEEDKRWQ